MDWGWVGVHSLPFTITRATGPVQNSHGLAYRVAEEVEALRLPGSRALSEHGRRQAGKVQWHAAAKGTAIELALNVSLPPSSSAVCHAGLVVRATADRSEQTTISLWRSSNRVDLIVNRTLSSLSHNQSRTFQEAPLPSAMMGRTDNMLRVFVDKSVIEIFVGDHTILSTRVYPTAGDAAAEVGTFSSGGGCELSGALKSWQMENVYRDTHSAD